MGAPIVSVLMAVYNTGSFLPEALDSMMAQTYEHWELICVNDGSTDNSLHVLNEYRRREPRVVVLDRPHCGTAAGARNHGLAVARGRFVAVLDSDDKIEPGYLEKLVSRQTETGADIVVASTQFWRYQEDAVVRSLTGVEGDTERVVSGRDAVLLSLDWQIGGLGLHTAAILKEMGFCERGMNGDEYTTRLMFLGAQRVAFCNAAYYYRLNESSTTKQFSYRWFSSILVGVMLARLLRKNGFGKSTVVAYREDIAVSLVGSWAGFVRRWRVLARDERKAVGRWLGRATIEVGGEMLSPPFSARSPLRVLRRLVGLGVGRARRRDAVAARKRV